MRNKSINKKVFLCLILFALIGCVQNTPIKESSVNEVPALAITISPTVTILPTKTRQGNYTPEPITNNPFIAPYGCPQYGDTDKYNGYYYDDPQTNNELCQRKRYWIPGVANVESQFLIMPDVVIGSAWAYNPELMLATAHFHSISLRDVEGGVAIPFCSEIGNYVWILRPYHEGILGTGEWEGPFLVVDCAALSDLYNVVAVRNEVVEVDFNTAKKWTMVKNMEMVGEGLYKFTWDFRSVDDVIISKINPDCLPDDFEPVRLDEWFKNRAGFYKNEEEYEKHVGDQLMILDEYHHEERYMMWRIDGEWKRFDLNNLTCP